MLIMTWDIFISSYQQISSHRKQKSHHCYVVMAKASEFYRLPVQYKCGHVNMMSIKCSIVHVTIFYITDHMMTIMNP